MMLSAYAALRTSCKEAHLSLLGWSINGLLLHRWTQNKMLMMQSNPPYRVPACARSLARRCFATFGYSRWHQCRTLSGTIFPWNILVDRRVTEMAMLLSHVSCGVSLHGRSRWRATKLSLSLDRSLRRPIATCRRSASSVLAAHKPSYRQHTSRADHSAAPSDDISHAAMQWATAAEGASCSGAPPPQQQPHAPKEVVKAPIVAVSLQPACSPTGGRIRDVGSVIAPSFVRALCCACIGLALAALLSPGHALAAVDAASNPISGKACRYRYPFYSTGALSTEITCMFVIRGGNLSVRGRVIALPHEIACLSTCTGTGTPVSGPCYSCTFRSAVLCASPG